MIVAGGESIVYPQERAYLTACQGFLQHLDAISLQLDNLARTYVTQHLVVKVGETGRLAGDSIRLDELVSTNGRQAMNLLLTNHDGGTSQEVTCGNDAVLCKNQYGAGTVNLLVYLINTLYKRVPHIDEQGYEFGLVDIVGRHLAEVHALLEQFVGDFAKVIDFGNSHYCIASQMGVDDDGLRISVANNT